MPFPSLWRASVLATLLMTASVPAWAQQAMSSDEAASEPAIDVPRPTPEAAIPTGDDAQLPRYLRGDPFAHENDAYDPWERYNRGVFRFNEGFDRAFLKPLAKAYVHVVPDPFRNGVSNFFSNLRQPVSAVNLLLQGHPGSACKSLGRFAVNSTIGIGGLFDPARHMHLMRYDEDFGQTLGRWGWRRSRYFLLPFMGPGTVRDRIGSLADTPYGPIRYLNPPAARAAVIGLEVVDLRANLLPLDELGVGVEDDYVLVREAWTQRRMHQIDDQQAETTVAPATSESH
jgi:phospholipid-binding lipoprotein MlaA